MRLALLSDVHANRPALEAVMADVATRAVECTYHIGDLVGYGPWPNETVDLIRQSHMAGVAGNYDSTVAAAYKHCGCKYTDARQEEISHASFEWTKRHVSEPTRQFLGALPFRLDVRSGGGHAAGSSLILVHGTPTLNTVYWTEDRSDAFCTQMAGIAGAKSGDLIAFGHTHKPWHREIAGIHFVNTGSVGRPKDGDWRAGYVVVDLSSDGAAVEFVRVNYDLDRTMKAIHESELPDDLAEYLRNGGDPKGA